MPQPSVARGQQHKKKTQWEGWHTLSSLLITATLNNCKHLWAHVCRRGLIETSCAHGALWQQFETDAVGWSPSHILEKAHGSLHSLWLVAVIWSRKAGCWLGIGKTTLGRKWERTHLLHQPNITSFLGLALNINIISFTFLPNTTWKDICWDFGSCAQTLVSTVAFALAASQIGREMSQIGREVSQIGGQILYPKSGHLSLWVWLRRMN